MSTNSKDEVEEKEGENKDKCKSPKVLKKIFSQGREVVTSYKDKKSCPNMLKEFSKMNSMEAVNQSNVEKTHEEQILIEDFSNKAVVQIRNSIDGQSINIEKKIRNNRLKKSINMPCRTSTEPNSYSKKINSVLTKKNVLTCSSYQNKEKGINLEDNGDEKLKATLECFRKTQREQIKGKSMKIQNQSFKENAQFELLSHQLPIYHSPKSFYSQIDNLQVHENKEKKISKQFQIFEHEEEQQIMGTQISSHFSDSIHLQKDLSNQQVLLQANNQISNNYDSPLKVQTTQNNFQTPFKSYRRTSGYVKSEEDHYKIIKNSLSPQNVLHKQHVFHRLVLRQTEKNRLKLNNTFQQELSQNKQQGDFKLLINSLSKQPNPSNDTISNSIHFYSAPQNPYCIKRNYYASRLYSRLKTVDNLSVQNKTSFQKRLDDFETQENLKNCIFYSPLCSRPQSRNYIFPQNTFSSKSPQIEKQDLNSFISSRPFSLGQKKEGIQKDRDQHLQVNKYSLEEEYGQYSGRSSHCASRLLPKNVELSYLKSKSIGQSREINNQRNCLKTDLNSHFISEIIGVQPHVINQGCLEKYSHADLFQIKNNNQSPKSIMNDQNHSRNIFKRRVNSPCSVIEVGKLVAQRNQGEIIDRQFDSNNKGQILTESTQKEQYLFEKNKNAHLSTISIDNQQQLLGKEIDTKQKEEEKLLVPENGMNIIKLEFMSGDTIQKPKGGSIRRYDLVKKQIEGEKKKKKMQEQIQEKEIESYHYQQHKSVLLKNQELQGFSLYFNKKGINNKSLSDYSNSQTSKIILDIPENFQPIEEKSSGQLLQELEIQESIDEQLLQEYQKNQLHSSLGFVDELIKIRYPSRKRDSKTQQARERVLILDEAENSEKLMKDSKKLKKLVKYYDNKYGEKLENMKQSFYGTNEATLNNQRKNNEQNSSQIKTEPQKNTHELTPQNILKAFEVGPWNSSTQLNEENSGEIS